MRNAVAIAAFLLGSWMFAPPATAQTATASVGYQIVDLGTLGGKTSDAAAINENGHIIGKADMLDGTHHAFLWRDGKMIDLGTLGGSSSEALAINGHGDIVGYSYTSAAPHDAHAFIYHDGKLTDLGGFPDWDTKATGINAQGEIVGYANRHPPHASQYRVLLWREREMIDLGAAAKSLETALAINDHGAFVGVFQANMIANGSRMTKGHGYIFRDGAVVDLGALAPFPQSSLATAINHRGEVVGNSQNVDNNPRAFLWRDGTMTDLGTLGGVWSNAYAINSSGEVAGLSFTGGKNFQVHACLWRKGEAIDLGTLGGDRSEAHAINDAGWIAGSSRGLDGHEHAVLWRPPPAAPGAGR